ncbi:unnamed protein product [Trichogramma brassicae]|uniref:Uncharacterized protein n=1 Tax=Trichogramma brassicae TaxID=86971 RepID=A0A6H5J1F1_9HYME|nr:unnamed protein product [Trichogramma brassicae]
MTSRTRVYRLRVRSLEASGSKRGNHRANSRIVVFTRSVIPVPQLDWRVRINSGKTMKSCSSAASWNTDTNDDK